MSPTVSIVIKGLLLGKLVPQGIWPLHKAPTRDHLQPKDQKKKPLSSTSAYTKIFKMEMDWLKMCPN